MVHIKRMMIKNFKSFSGSVKLNFQSGTNVITGPNGSGKSNIIDAVQFVFGELGSRRMRVSELSGLIYDNADETSTKRTKTAQVSLYFNNSDRGIAIDKNTVSVSRKIDPNGRSHYFLNGRRTSRREMLDLLEMAGISPGGYNIVPQGTATKLSDITPIDRIHALEDLVGIAEYDEKKLEATVRLSEAERKVEIASARIGEVRKRVQELERQRNDALRYSLLINEEMWLNALKLSYDLSQYESKIEKLRSELSENNRKLAILNEEVASLTVDKSSFKARFEAFNREAREKGNTRLPLLKSDYIEKKMLKTSLESKLQRIDSRKQLIRKEIEVKLTELKEMKKEREDRHRELIELTQREALINSEIMDKESRISDFNDQINSLKKSAETNQRLVEELTESISHTQDMLSGLEIEANRHQLNTDNLEDRLLELERKKIEGKKATESLLDKIRQFEELKASEKQKLEKMLNTIEEQLKRQKKLRSNINNANKLAKKAEVTITQYSAKRDIWKKISTEEKAKERIQEMGEAGALPGYHGILRSLLKIDLKYQRAARVSSNGWIRAVVVDEMETILDCVERLKKTKLGMIRFLPLKNIKRLESLPTIEGVGILGIMPRLIRYDAKYESVVNFVWGDTLLVRDRSVALGVVGKGYRAVTLAGEVYEADGGVLGGYYRKPPDFTKLIPSEKSVKLLSETIRKLGGHLQKRMSDLKLSGGNLREFMSYLEQSSHYVDGLDGQIRDVKDGIKRSESKLNNIHENCDKIKQKLEQERGLIKTIQERREKTIQEIERTKVKLAELKERSKPSDVMGLDLNMDEVSHEVSVLRDKRSQVKSDISIQTNLISQYLELKIQESEEQIKRWREAITSLENEYEETLRRLEQSLPEIEELQKDLKKITSEVESTSLIMQQHANSLNLVEEKIEKTEGRRSAIGRRTMGLEVELEKLRLLHDQRQNRLIDVGFKDKLNIKGIDLDLVEEILFLLKREKTSLGAINQLAVGHYAEVVGNYKKLSIRINELEEEKRSIFKFIEEVEREKQHHFMEAYNEVIENFSFIFAKLTGGGDGRLELQKPEKPFTAGVDLYIQFPGKPMRLASGTSGGERSVAAIAYLLAIQRFLKAPFYLFDEIDAHLDDLNVSRLADVLRENSKESQFIIVTLKDVMVHNADRIYGVFSHNGRSKVLTLPMEMKVAH